MHVHALASGCVRLSPLPPVAVRFAHVARRPRGYQQIASASGGAAVPGVRGRSRSRHDTRSSLVLLFLSFFHSIPRMPRGPRLPQPSCRATCVSCGAPRLVHHVPRPPHGRTCLYVPFFFDNMSVPTLPEPDREPSCWLLRPCSWLGSSPDESARLARRGGGGPPNSNTCRRGPPPTRGRPSCCPPHQTRCLPLISNYRRIT